MPNSLFYIIITVSLEIGVARILGSRFFSIDLYEKLRFIVSVTFKSINVCKPAEKVG